MMTTNILAKREGLKMAGLVTGLVLGVVNLASAQVLFRTDPGKLPDLTVSVNAPAVVDQSVFLVTIRVDNQAPTTYPWSVFAGSSDVMTWVDLTVLVPVYVQADGNLTCTLWPIDNGFNQVGCGGSIPYGGTATIHVYVYSTSKRGIPSYTDASVKTYNERSTANNRAIARTDPMAYWP